MKSSDIRPEDYQAPILAADTLRGLEKPDEVIRWFRRGIAAAEEHVEHHPQEGRALYLGAHAHHGLGNREKAVEWSERAMQMAPRDPATLYNLGCLFCLTGQIDRCFECFQTAVEHGFSHLSWLESDPDLEPIRSDPRFADLVRALSVSGI